MERSPSIAGRAMLALLLTVGFYLLVLVLAAALVALPIVLHTQLRAGAGFAKLDLALLGAAFGLVASAWPRREEFHAPGIPLDPEQQPRLFAVVREVADAVGEQMPHEIYLNGQLNAAVTHRGGRLGIGQTRILILGLPLLAGLRDDEMRAVLAHEFGHFAGGDTKVGAWLYRTRSSIGRTIGDLEQGASWLRFLFVGYGKLFMRVTHAVSRQQEFAADRISARVQGAAVATSALAKLPELDVGYQLYLDREYVPLLNLGRRPPFVDGFRGFLTAREVSEIRQKVFEHALSQHEHDPYDTHPPIGKRIEALLGPGVAAEPMVGGRAAVAWLDGVPELEVEVLHFMTGNESVRTLPELGWDDVGRELVVPRAREIWGRVPPSVLEGVTVGGLADLAPRFVEIAGAIAQACEVPADAFEDDDSRRGFAAQALGDCVLAALADAGWRVDSELGGAYVASFGEHRFAVRRMLWEVVRGELDADGWRQQWAAAGVAELPLEAPPELVARVAPPPRDESAPAPRAPAPRAAAPAVKRVKRPRRSLRDRKRSRGGGSRWWVIVAVMVAIGLVRVVTRAGRSGPREPEPIASAVEVFTRAVERGDVDVIVGMFVDPDRDGLREGVARLLEDVGRGAVGRTYAAAGDVDAFQPGRARVLFRVGDVSLETGWAWHEDGRWEVTSIDRTR